MSTVRIKLKVKSIENVVYIFIIKLIPFSSDANTSHAHYKKFLISLLKLFEENRPLLENRGAFIIRYNIFYPHSYRSINIITNEIFMFIHFEYLKPTMHSIECWSNLPNFRRNNFRRDDKFEICIHNGAHTKYNSPDNIRIIWITYAFKRYHKWGKQIYFHLTLIQKWIDKSINFVNFFSFSSRNRPLYSSAFICRGRIVQFQRYHFVY